VLRLAQLVTSLLLCVAVAGASAQAPPPGQAAPPPPGQAKPLVNDDILKMVKAGLPESTIIGAMQANPTDFDVSPAGLIALHDAGVSQAIMDAMLAAKSGKPAVRPRATTPRTPSASGRSSGKPAPPTPAVHPAVMILQGETRQEINIERTQVTQTTAKAKSLGALSTDKLLNQGIKTGVSGAMDHVGGGGVGDSVGNTAGAMLGGLMSSSTKPKKLTYVWALPNLVSAVVAASETPAFEVSMGKTRGVTPEEYAPAVVALTPTPNGMRLVCATEGQEGAGRSSLTSWPVYSGFMEDRVAAEVQSSAPGVWQIRVSKPLLPGEYAVVLRALSKDKKIAGQDVARAQGDGLLLNSAWSFSVK
jgi:hypothetical protein